MARYNTRKAAGAQVNAAVNEVEVEASKSTQYPRSYIYWGLSIASIATDRDESAAILNSAIRALPKRSGRKGTRITTPRPSSRRAPNFSITNPDWAVANREPSPNQAEASPSNDTPKAKRRRPGRPAKKNPEPGHVDTEVATRDSIGMYSLPDPTTQSPEYRNLTSSSSDASIVSDADVADLDDFNTILFALKHDRREIENHANQQPPESESQAAVLKEQLRSLTKSYIALRTARIAGRRSAISAAQTKVTLSVKRITTMASELRLDTRPVLTDVYLDLLPTFVDAVKTGVDAHTTRGPTTTISIPETMEITNLLRLVYKFATRATRQPANLQPMAMDQTYFLLKPTLEILPTIKKVQNTFLAERERIQQAQYRAYQEELSAELEIQQQDADPEQEQEERRRREESIDREQRGQIIHAYQEKMKHQKAMATREIREKRKSQGKSPDAGPVDQRRSDWINAEIKMERCRAEASGMGATAAPSRPETSRSRHVLGSLDHADLVDDEPVNKRQKQSLNTLSREDMSTFTDIMRTGEGIIVLI